MTTMPIDNNSLTQRSLQSISISVNKLTFLYSINIIQSSNNYIYNIVCGFIYWNQNILHKKILDNLMMGSIFRQLLTELGIGREDAECNLMGEMLNFDTLVLIIKAVWLSTIPRQAINTLAIKMIQLISLCLLQRKGRNKCPR